MDADDFELYNVDMLINSGLTCLKYMDLHCMSKMDFILAMHHYYNLRISNGVYVHDCNYNMSDIYYNTIECTLNSYHTIKLSELKNGYNVFSYNDKPFRFSYGAYKKILESVYEIKIINAALPIFKLFFVSLVSLQYVNVEFDVYYDSFLNKSIMMPNIRVEWNINKDKLLPSIQCIMKRMISSFIKNRHNYQKSKNYLLNLDQYQQAFIRLFN